MLYAAAITVVGGLCALDLVLTFGVLRRLRAQASQLAELRHPEHEVTILPAGGSVGALEATTLSGVSLSASLFDRETLVGFFSPGCEGCAQALPRFVRSAAAFTGGAEQVLAVVAAAGDDVEEYVDRLRPVAQVAVEDPMGPIATAFTVQMFPAFALVGAGGAVVASGSTLDEIPVPVPG
jgi:hypothetical protein